MIPTPPLTPIALGVLLMCASVPPARGGAPSGGSLLATGDAEVRIVDASTGQGVPYANLVFLDRRGGYLSDAHGICRLRGVPGGRLRFRATHISYVESGSEVVNVVPDEIVVHVVELAPRVHEMEAIEVTAEHETAVSRSARGQRTVTAEATAALPNPSDDAFQMIRVLPGIASNDVGGVFHIRGGGEDETLVRIDGLEVRQLFHGRDLGGIAGIVPSAAVAKSDVYPGGFPAEYGGRLSGVIDIGLREDGPRGFHGKLAMDLISTRAFAEWHGPRSSMLVSAREGYLDRVLAAVQDRATIQPVYRDLLIRGVHRPGPGRSLSINYLRTEDHLLYEDSLNDHLVDADAVDHYVWTSGRFTPWNRIHVEGTGYVARSTQLWRTNESDRDDHRRDRVGGRLQASMGLPGHHLFTAGAQFDRETGKLDLRSRELVSVSADGANETVLDFEGSESFRDERTAIFLQDEWTPARFFSMHLGARGTRHRGIDELRVNPRTAATLTLPRGWRLTGAWGIYDQLPDVGFEGELELRIRTDRTERAEHAIVGVEKSFGAVTAGVDAYSKTLHTLNGLVGRVREGELEVEVVDRGRARGIEAFARGAMRGANWWASYALARSEWGNERATFSRSFDRLHSLTFAGTLRITSAWDVGMSYSFHSGLPYTKQTWKRDEQEREWILDEGVPNADRLPPYHRLDVRIRRHFHFQSWSLAVYAEGLNLMNHDNVLWYSWRFRRNEGVKVPVRTPRTGMPGIPSIGVEVRF